MAMFVCPTGITDRNIHVSAKTSYNENTAPLPAVNHLRSEECILMAELPFLKADIREIFEIPLKNDFKPRKRRQQFWRRSQLWRRKLWCRRPKVMEQQQQGREENQEVTQEQNPANKGPKILDKIEDVQELIFTKEPDLLRALIPVQTMHLTIIVAHLRTEDDVKKAVVALEQSKAKVEAILQGKLFNMTFHGIGQFNNQVIYVKMSDDEQQMLSKIAEAVEGSFSEMGLDITGSKDFKPHLTFLKLSKAPALRRKL